MSGHYFVSDLHLGSGEHFAERRFIEFLLSIKGKSAGLYILGDLFEFWFEYRRVVPKVGLDVLAVLRELSESGTKIFLFRGNHDIWFKGWLETELKAQGVFDELEMEIDGLRVFLAHGDSLDRALVPRFFRFLMRSSVNGFLFSFLHPDIGVGLARLVSAKSRQAMLENGAAVALQTALAAFAEKKIAKGCDVVMLGHSHIPEIRSFGSGTYINTGDWLKNFTYGLIKDGKAALERF
ncbi:MAG: UDP-2,3-diacylglucosamine diphosphatase [bacterium]